MVTEAKELTAIILKLIDERRTERRISPSWVATEAMVIIDPDRVSPQLVRLGCHLELRQIARSVLRTRFAEADEDEEASKQHEMFPELQWRYPTSRSSHLEEPEYVRLEDMTDDDVSYNVARLRSEAMRKLAHADALEAWGRRRAA